jgi:hypothetical protein
MKVKDKLCMKCRKSTRGKDWVETMGIRMCLDCLKKSKEERLGACPQRHDEAYNGRSAALPNPGRENPEPQI